MAFKMKGTPMLRNFGVSPLKQEDIVSQQRITADESLVSASQSQQGPVTQPDFTIKNADMDFDGEGGEGCDEECKEKKRLKREERKRKRRNKKDSKYYGSKKDKRKNSSKNKKK